VATQFSVLPIGDLERGRQVLSQILETAASGGCSTSGVECQRRMLMRFVFKTGTAT
jgi:hypothetical protein